MVDQVKQIIAQMLEEGRIEISKESSEDYIAAASLVFDNGLLYLNQDERRDLINDLRASHPGNKE